MTSNTVLRITGLKKKFAETEVIHGVDLEVHAGETVAIVGASGSGKSTLLRCVNWLEVPTQGSIWVDGEIMGCRVEPSGAIRRISETKIAMQRRKVGMVFQDFNLFPHMTALENITDGLRSVLRYDHASAVKRAMELLTRVGLQDRAKAYPRQLSGGQQQRVAIARALALEPKLMLFDEPTSALDQENVEEVTDVLSDLAASGVTMLVVTHELAFARAAADRVIYMDDGVIVEQGTPNEIFTNAREARTREFFKSALAAE